MCTYIGGCVLFYHSNMYLHTLFSAVGLGRLASVQYIDSVKVGCKADDKDSNGDPYSNMDGAEVEELEVREPEGQEQ